jgi:lipopolysaccharide/colanic/teichoic acid biosynthesis glycosyltransferase
MRKLKLNALWKPYFIGAGDKAGKFGIYSPVLIQQVLQYERSRADREGGYFSVVLFTLKEPDSQNARFVKLLKNSTRLIDHLGWYDATTVCVVLTATDTDGAELFARKIQGSVETMSGNGRHPAPPYEVFSYPDQERGQGEGKLKISRNIYRDNDLCINEKLKQFLGREIPLWKRSLDIIGSLAGLILLAPLFALTALHIKLVSKGPVLYTQQRVGFKGRSFTFLKFRTMKQNNDEGLHSNHASNFIARSDIPMEKLDDHDPRIIFGGRVIRKACIDEFPQLWNVLRGDMSLVGPRPCIPYEAETYLRWHAQRFDIMPGATGLWQVSGKNKLTFHEMISLDIKYSRKMSLGLDLKIILLTVPAITEMVWESVCGKLGICQNERMMVADSENG